jgi:hypothetical protein
MAQITEVSTTESSITVRVSGLASTAKYCEFYIDGDRDKYYTLSGTSQKHTYTGLRSGRTYTCSAIVYDANWQPLPFKNNSIDITTDSVQEYQQDLVYHSGSATPRRQTIQGDGSIRDGGNFFTAPSGFTFYGWAESTGDKVPDYYAGDSYTATGYDDVHLYAIWKYEDPTGVTFYYGYNMSATPNYRKLLGYAYNTSSSRQTTEYESVQTPAMTAGNITVVDRAFSPIGWRSDTANNGSGLTGGNQYVAVSQSKCVFYAVYQNTAGIRVSYNSNGGSGTMASSTVPGTMYYNTAQTLPTTITVTPRSCEFTPPRGYQFQGWSTRADGSIVTSISTSYDATFYAQWISARPADWDWSGYLYLNGVKKPYNMTVGGKPPMVKQADGSYYAYYMGAAEWNKFVKRIEEVASYLEISLNVRDINGASATAGQKMLTYQAQCIVNMLNTLGASNVPVVPTSMSVSFFNGIRDSLNNRKNRGF